MVQQIHHQGSGEDESRRRDERARRKPADAAYSVTAGASAAEARAESDQQTRDGQQWEGANEAELERTREQLLEQQPAREQARQEADAPERVALDGLQDAGQDSADTGDLAVQQQHRRRAETDERAAGQGRKRGKVMHRRILRAAPSPGPV